jgi:hypothetical protein
MVRPSGKATAPPANSTAATRARSTAKYVSTRDATSCMPGRFALVDLTVNEIERMQVVNYFQNRIN